MANIQRELFEYEKIIFDELCAKGYPKESIVLEGKLDARRFVDFLITDVDTGLPVMMIEVKTCSDRTQNAVVEMAYNNLKAYYIQSKSPIKAVAAIFSRLGDEKLLEFIDFTEAVKEDNFSRLVRPYSLPSYEVLTIGARQKAINKQKEDQEKKIAALKWLCWLILPAVCLALVLLDAFEVYTLSSLRLITIGAGAAVSLIPCFKEIKIGEITLKNIIEKQKEESK